MMEERGRYEKLEEQMNDLTELHQNEMENIKVGPVEKNKTRHHSQLLTYPA